jgi:hypothetical protein
MGVTSTQGFAFKLVANGNTQLDLFDDEEILLSDNITGLFDVGVLPADFTRQIMVPGTKKNNAFFEHVYDISITNPYLFSTNQKVPCYLDFDGIYLASGYLQLNRVNIIANKFIDSYEITIFGGLSSFARDINRFFLTDLTASLSQFNHTASYENITASWDGDLFSGSIVYPLAEYGQRIIYSPEENIFGIDAPDGALAVQDFKPAIRIKEVWDAIFETYGYTYSGSFFEQEWLDNVYMICNNGLRYPVFSDIDLETYGLFKISPLSGSGVTNLTISPGSDLQLPWYNIQSNPGGNMSADLNYSIDFSTRLRGELGLNFEVSSSGAGNGIPQFDLIVKTTGGSTVSTVPLTNINNFMTSIQVYNNTQTRTEKFQLVTEFNTGLLPSGSYNFFIKYTEQGGSNFSVILNPGSTLTNTFLEVKKVNQGGDNQIIDIPANMPFGTTGIKQIDFITGLQKKFNLIIYPNKLKPKEFIVEEFNKWYKQGQVLNFNKYINLDKPIAAIPANNLAVNKLNFGDTLDGDYVSQQFAKENSREYGKEYYVDTQNFFSQGEFNVKTTFASSPLVYLANTGLSGSFEPRLAEFGASATATADVDRRVNAFTGIKHFTTTVVRARASAIQGTSVFDCDPSDCGFITYEVASGDILTFEADGSVVGGLVWEFTKETDGGVTVLDTGTGTDRTFQYQITATDISSTILRFRAEATCDD